MAYFVVLRTGGRYELTSVNIPIKHACNWIEKPYGKKAAFSQSFELSQPNLEKLFGGSLKSNELRYSDRGVLVIGEVSYYGYLYIVNYQKGRYQVSFIENADEIFEKNVNELATIRNGAYNDIFLTFDASIAHWTSPIDVDSINVYSQEYLNGNKPEISIRVDAIVNLINSNNNYKIAVHEWMTRIFVLSTRGKIYSAFAEDNDEDFDYEQIGQGTNYGIFWNLPKVTLFDFLSKLAFCAGYATYFEGNSISYISFNDLFDVSQTNDVGNAFVNADAAQFGTLKAPLGFVRSKIDILGKINGKRANGTSMSEGTAFEADVNFSQNAQMYVETEYDDEGVEKRSWSAPDEINVDCLACDITPYVQQYCAFLQMTANNPKKLKLTLIGTHWRIYDKLYIPQLNTLILPLNLTKNANSTTIEGVVLTEFNPNEVLLPEYVFQIGEGSEGDAAFETYINISPADNQDECLNLYDVYAYSRNVLNSTFRPYIVRVEWENPLTILNIDDVEILIDENADVTQQGNQYLVSRNNSEGMALQVRGATERIKLTIIDAQTQQVGTFDYVPMISSVNSALLTKINFEFVSNGGKTYDTYRWLLKSVYGNGLSSECGTMPIRAVVTPYGCNTLTDVNIQYLGGGLVQIDVPTNNGIDLKKQQSEADPRDLQRGYMPTGVTLTVTQTYNNTLFNTFTETKWRNPNGTTYFNENYANVNLTNFSIKGSRTAKSYFHLGNGSDNWLWLSLNGEYLNTYSGSYSNILDMTQSEIFQKLRIVNTISQNTLNALTDGFRTVDGQTNFNRFLCGVTAYPYAKQSEIEQYRTKPNFSIACDNVSGVPSFSECAETTFNVYIAFIQPPGSYYYNYRDYNFTTHFNSSTDRLYSFTMEERATFKGKLRLYRTYTAGNRTYELSGTFEKRDLTDFMQNCVLVDANNLTITAYPLICIDNRDNGSPDVHIFDDYTMTQCYLRNLELKLLFSKTQLSKEM